MALFWSRATPPARPEGAGPSQRRFPRARRLYPAAAHTLRASANLRIFAPFQLGLRALWRYPHRAFLDADARRDFSGPEVGRILGAWRRAAFHFAGVPREPHLAGSARAHFRATGPHLRGRIRPEPAVARGDELGVVSTKITGSESSCTMCAKSSAPCVKTSIR